MKSSVLQPKLAHLSPEARVFAVTAIAIAVGLLLSPVRMSNHTTAPNRAGFYPAEVMLQDLNAHRRTAGLLSLVSDSRLQYAALQHADDMIAKNYFDHNSPSGETPFQRLKADRIPFDWAGENIAQSDLQKDAQQALWMSPDHRANILNPHYTKVGISVVPMQDGQIMFVQEFTN